MVQTFAAAGLGFFLYMILITYASVTAQEVASEKGTKLWKWSSQVFVLVTTLRTHDRLLLVIFDSYWYLCCRRTWAILFFGDMPLLANSGYSKSYGEKLSVNTLLFVIVSLEFMWSWQPFLGSYGLSRLKMTGKALISVDDFDNSWFCWRYCPRRCRR